MTAATAQSLPRLFFRRQRSYNTKRPLGPICTIQGHNMTGLNYSKAVSSSNADDGGAGPSSSMPKKQSNTQGQHQNQQKGPHQNTGRPAQKSSSPRNHHRNKASDPKAYKYPPEAYPAMIVSLWLDEALQEHFSKLRSKYFPHSRNHLQGHLTLFHALPSEHLEFLTGSLSAICAATKHFNVRCQKPTLSRNNAVFIPVTAKNLSDLHKELQQTFKQHLELTAQDANPRFWPHATVVNKVDEEEAKRVFDEVKDVLSTSNATSQGSANGLDLWFYRGGPWEHVQRIPFGNVAKPT